MKRLFLFLAWHRIPFLGLLIVITLTTIAYSNITTHQFLHWDDIEYILKNDKIKAFTLDNILWMFGDFGMANWHPLTWLTYAIDYAIWGANPIAYKITNIAFHVFNSLLIYALALKLLTLAKNNFHINRQSRFSLFTHKDLQYASLLSAILFAIHPLHVESVTWISERKDVLYSLFFLLTLLFYINHREKGDNQKWLIASLLMFLLSLMSKPMSVTTPLILILIDIYPLRIINRQLSIKHSTRLLLANKLSFLLLAFLVSIITLLAQRAGIQGSEELPFSSRIINSCMSILQYIYHFFWPANLSPFYSFHPWSTDPNIFSLLPLSAIIVASIYFIYLAAKKHIYFPIVSWLYLIISLLPVLGIIKVGVQAAADRYTYMPLLCLFIISGVGLQLFINFIKPVKLQVTIGTLVVAFLISNLTFLSYQQNEHWMNDESLWKKAINYSPGIAAIPYNNLGTMHFRLGNFRTAVIELNKSLAIAPNDVVTLEQLGKTYELMKEPRYAIYTYTNLIKAHPDHPLGYIRLGDLYYRRKELELAKQLYNKAFTLSPTLPAAMLRGALADNLNEDYQAAERKLTYILQLSPGDIGALQLLAKVCINLGQFDKANNIVKKLLKKNPKDTFAQDMFYQLNRLDK